MNFNIETVSKGKTSGTSHGKEKSKDVVQRIVGWMTSPGDNRLQIVQKLLSWVFAASFVFGLLGVVIAALGFVFGDPADLDGVPTIGALASLPFGLIFIPVFMTGAFVIYTAPSLIAYVRNHRNFTPLLIINIAFGWLLVGWIIAIAWAFSSHVVDETASH